jgi:hypothetical protein
VIRRTATLEEAERAASADAERAAIAHARHRLHSFLRGNRSAQVARLTFVAVLGVALVLFLIFGHSQWFFLDDWDFLANREARDVGDLLRPHNEHWSTLPILVYRALWPLFGLRTYVPYQLIAILLHLTAAVLLRRVMRRAGVGPWIATAAASLFALFGAGDQNIVWAFQMAWSASLVLGLTHLLLADHDGPVDRRDWLGLFAGFIGVLCSGVAVTMTVVVGLAALMRRGWRAALFHTVPLGLLYLVWWLAFARDRYATASGSVDVVVGFIATGLAATFGEMGQVPGAGFALGALLVTGLILAWRGLDLAQLRKRAAVPGALLIGAALFLAIAGVGRAADFGSSAARASRYLHIVAALSLPALAVAAAGFMRHRRMLGYVAIALLLVGLPGNVNLLVHRDTRLLGFLLGNPDLMLTLPQTPVAHDVPRGLRPAPDVAPDVTVGWLLDGVAAGRVPDPGRVNPAISANATLRLSLLQSHRPTTVAHCRALHAGVTRTLTMGQAVGIRGGRIRVSLAASPILAVSYTPRHGRTLVAVHGPLTVRMESAVPSRKLATLCE